jgi:H+/Cl- antiporter ClcA
VTKDDDGTSNTGTDTGSDTGTDTTGDGTGTSSWFTGARAALRPALKAAAAVVTLGAGASLGPEGPSVEIGAAIAGSLNEASTGTGGVAGGRGGSTHETNRQKARRKTINQSRRLGLVAAGSAAGISAGFGAPIAGLFFAFEAVLQPAQMRRNAALAVRGVGGSGGGGTDDDDLDTDGGGGSTGFGASTTESVILASVLAAVVSNALLGEQPAFVVPAFELKNLAELPLYLPLGLLCGGTCMPAFPNPGTPPVLPLTRL